MEATPSVHELQTTPSPSRQCPTIGSLLPRRFTNNNRSAPSHSDYTAFDDINRSPRLLCVMTRPPSPTTMARAFPHVAQSHAPCATPHSAICSCDVSHWNRKQIRTKDPKANDFVFLPGGVTVPEVTPTHTHTGLTSKRLLLLKITTLYDENKLTLNFGLARKRQQRLKI